MLSLWKLRVGVEAYYLAQVASGLDDYYTGAGEAVGVWTGHGAAGLGLAGEVDAADLRAVLAGLAPDTGSSPNGDRIRPHRRRVPGFDLTFSVPKSVSVVWALGDPLVKGAVLDAAEAALDDTLAWLEREAVFVRRGTNDVKLRSKLGGDWGTRRMVTGGVVAARFRHRSSRAGDPHLHWHVLVANSAQGIDGRWSALDGTALYAAKRSAGVLFQSALRRELSERLGVSWGPSRNDSAEVMGVPRRVLRAFSQRREQIAEWMDDHGTSGPGAADDAMLATRTVKPEVGFEALQIEWEARSTALGFAPSDLDALLARSPMPAEADQGENGGFEEWLDDLLEARLTLHSSTFTRHDLTQAVAGTLPAGATTATIEAAVQRCLASDLIVTVTPAVSMVIGPLAARGDSSGVRYSSRQLLEIESTMMRELVSGRQVADVPDSLVSDFVRVRESIGFDQAHAVELLCQPDAVQVLVGRPGTGKTYTLRTVADIYRAAGRDMIGLAPSARAARELHDGAGISSRTIASFLLQPPHLDAGSVVVVDEAAMAGTRDLAAVTSQVAAAGAKLILVGDHHQLPEINAGGAFRAVHDTLAAAPGRVAELTVNRRQRHLWEHHALDQLRVGDVASAWAAYREHDRVTLTATPDELRDRLVDDWARLRAVPRPDGRKPEVVVLAGTRAETTALNHAIRQRLAAGGELVGRSLVVRDREFQTGDRVVLLRNDVHQRDLDGLPVRVDNGMLATVTAVDVSCGTLIIDAAGLSRPVVLDAGYVAGHVDHGYALTVHKAQGMTCDHVLVAGPHGLNREAGYVALSRARDTAHLYATVRDDADLAERHARGIPLPDERPDDPETELLARLSRSGAKQLALTINPDALAINTLAGRPVAGLLAAERHARDVAATAPCAEPDPAQLHAAIALRVHAEIGRRVRAVDRDNVGTIEIIDDDTGTCVVQFVNGRGRSRSRRFDWHQLVVIDHPDPVDLTASAIERLEAISADADHRHRLWNDHHHRHGVTPGDGARYRAAIERRIERTAAALRAEPPASIVSVLGGRPTDPAGAHVWDDTVDRIAEYSTLHDIDPSTLDATVDQPVDVEHWRELISEVVGAAEWLADDRHLPDRRSTLPVNERAERISELRRLAATAPAAEDRAIDTVPAGQSRPRQAATIEGEARRQWILEHWPQLVELEQLQRLDNADPLAAWPPACTPEVAAVLEQLRALAPAAVPEEARRLGDLASVVDQRRSERLDDLKRRVTKLTDAGTASDAAGRSDDVAQARRELMSARRTLREQQLLDHYLPPVGGLERARVSRAAQVVRAALIDRPAWVVDLVVQLQSLNDAAPTSVERIATLIAIAAVERDGGTRADVPPALTTFEATELTAATIDLA